MTASDPERSGPKVSFTFQEGAVRGLHIEATVDGAYYSFSSGNRQDLIRLDPGAVNRNGGFHFTGVPVSYIETDVVPQPAAGHVSWKCPDL